MDATFSVAYAFPVRFTRGAFAEGNDDLLDLLPGDGDGRPARVLVAVDAGVAEARPDLEPAIHRWFADRVGRVLLAGAPLVLPGGEAAKQDLTVVERVCRAAAEAGLCRHSYLLALGGGAFLDAVGLAAALFHRGVRLIRLPATVLAQCDSGVGVKCGINAFGVKNGMGVFAPPHGVLNDLDLLATLDDRAWRDGIAEAIKVAIIKDAGFLAWLLDAADRLAHRDAAAMETLVRRCAALHLDHIAGGGDPFERGSSRPLDFGHWAAHRLETLSRHRLSHGEAVALGLALDLGYAVARGFFPASAQALVLDALERVGFALDDPSLDLRDADGRRSLLSGLEQFREHLGGVLTLAMPDGIGRRQDIGDYDPAVLDGVIARLRARRTVAVRH